MYNLVPQLGVVIKFSTWGTWLLAVRTAFSRGYIRGVPWVSSDLVYSDTFSTCNFSMRTDREILTVVLPFKWPEEPEAEFGYACLHQLYCPWYQLFIQVVSHKQYHWRAIQFTVRLNHNCNSTSTVWCLVMMPAASFRSRLQRARPLLPLEAPSIGKMNSIW